MRVFRHTVQFTRGLKPFLSMPSNTPFLTMCRGLEVHDGFLRKMPVVDGICTSSLDWPFPILCHTGYITLMGERNRLSIIDSSCMVRSYVISKNTSYWTFARFEKYIRASSGSRNWDITPDGISAVSGLSNPVCRSVCAFRGRIVGGGILNSWYDCDSRYVAWSNIGSKSFDIDMKNEAGYMNVGIGEVLRVTSDDELVYCYGTDGVAVLFPAGSTFGYRRLSDIGILDIYCADRNIFVGSDGIVRQVVDREVKEIGYNWIFNGDAVVIYDGNSGSYYISDGVSTYKLTRWGLSQSNQLIYSIIHDDGNIKGVATDVYDRDSYEVITEWLSLDISGLKTVTGIELDIDESENTEIALFLKYINGGITADIGYIAVPEGFTVIKGSGDLVAVGVRGSASDGFRLSSVSLNIQIADKRVHRGYQI